MHGSQIQQGTTNSTQTQSNIEQSVDWDGLRAILSDLHGGIEKLAADIQDDARAEIATVEAQSKSSRRTDAILRACLPRLRDLLVNAGANVLAAPLISWMQTHNWLFQ
jgi:hypothetical protein